MPYTPYRSKGVPHPPHLASQRIERPGLDTRWEKVLYTSTRDMAPVAHERLWTVAAEGGPSTLLTAQWGTDGSFSPDGASIALDRIDRWDSEWRAYRGGQDTPLIVLNLKDLSETLIPNESTTDIQPL